MCSILHGRLTRKINEMVRSQTLNGTVEGAIIGQLTAGRNGIQTIFTFLDTQLPLPYVHIISLLVKVYRAWTMGL
jgi:hypothetical protein